MRILLVSPPFPGTFWSFQSALRLVGKRAALPPLGLITVAALLPESWSLSLVDMNISRLRTSDLDWADMVFVGAMTVQRTSAREVIRRAHAAGRPVVAGGPLFTCEAECFGEVEHLVLDEAEVTLPRFLDDLAAGRPQRVYRADEKPDLRQTPSPRWELLDLKRYAQMGVQFSRGCPFDCDFCNVTSMFGRKPRTKRVDQMIGEIDRLYAIGWRGPIFFVDDNLIGNRKEAGGLLDALAHWRKGKARIPFNTQASINLADDPVLISKMVDAGFDMVFIGIETPDEENLASCGKRQNLRRDMVADIRKLHQAGIQVQGGFIVGFDSDTEASFDKQIELIQNAGICTAMLGLLQAPPGTRLFDRLSVEGRILGFSSGDNVDGTTNIRTSMPIEALREGYRRTLQYLYSPPSFYQRVRTFLADYRPPRFSAPLAMRRRVALLRAFIRASLRLGVIDRGRLLYWRLLAGTLFTKPRCLGTAVTIWACGYHFRQVARRLA